MSCQTGMLSCGIFSVILSNSGLMKAKDVHFNLFTVFSFNLTWYLVKLSCYLVCGKHTQIIVPRSKMACPRRHLILQRVIGKNIFLYETTRPWVSIVSSIRPRPKSYKWWFWGQISAILGDTSFHAVLFKKTKTIRHKVLKFDLHRCLVELKQNYTNHDHCALPQGSLDFKVIYDLFSSRLKPTGLKLG